VASVVRSASNFCTPIFKIDLQGSYVLKYGFTLMAYELNLNNEVHKNPASASLW